MLSTLSRSGLGALLVVLIADWVATQRQSKLNRGNQFKRRLPYALFFALVLIPIFLTKGDLIIDRFFSSFIEIQYEGVSLLQSISSGRTIQWLDTIAKLSSSEHKFQWFFGYGMGHYAWETPIAIETEMHNQYLLFLYEYGFIIGSILSIYTIRTMFVFSWRSTEPLDRLARTMVVVFVISCFVQGFIYTTQIGWVLGIFGATLLYIYKRQKSLLLEKRPTVRVLLRNPANPS
jgi:hypothetical protein